MKNRFEDWIRQLRACLNEGEGPQVGEVTRLGGSPHLSCKRDQNKINVSRWGNPPSRGRVQFMAKSSKAKHVCFKTFYTS